MTTLTTVVGMLPLALAIGEGSEMLQPLAITLVGGLSFSLLVTLALVPATYHLAHSSAGRKPSGSPAAGGPPHDHSGRNSAVDGASMP